MPSLSPRWPYNPVSSGGAPTSRRDDGSADRRGVQDAARVPELVEPARDAERGAIADVALVDLAIIADMANDPKRPVPRQSEPLAVFALGADETHHLGLFRSHRLVDVGGIDTELLGVNQGEQRPLHQEVPVVVLLPHHRPERLLGNDVGKDLVLAGPRVLEAERV